MQAYKLSWANMPSTAGAQAEGRTSLTHDERFDVDGVFAQPLRLLKHLLYVLEALIKLLQVAVQSDCVSRAASGTELGGQRVFALCPTENASRAPAASARPQRHTWRTYRLHNK